MGQITLALLRKRAEHNEGLLSNLQEITLHGQNLEQIEVVGHVCRHLKILYLQNNVIGIIENLHHLKELEYLNLAINNITRVENLHGCESLRKLDLTMNFIAEAGLPSLDNLAGLRDLRELYLLGNPCTRWQLCRAFVIAKLPQLQILDGNEISAKERDKASEQLLELEAALERHLQGSEPATCMSEADRGGDAASRRWCPETRLRDHREQEALNREAEERKNESQAALLGTSKAPTYRQEMPPPPKAGTDVRQMNEGDWDFSLVDSDNDSSLVLDVVLGRGIVTSETAVDVQPQAVRLLAQGKLLQLALPEEVRPDASRAQRSTTTGNMVVRMPKLVQRHNAFRQLKSRQGTGTGSPQRRPAQECKSILVWKHSSSDDEAPPPL